MSRGEKKGEILHCLCLIFFPNFVPHQFSLTLIPHAVSMGIYLDKLLVLVGCNVNGINLI